MDNYLIHYGILGQKWGVRRYQNEDGTYTTEGKRRRNKGGDYHPDYARAHTKIDLSKLSDNELRAINNRLNMEKQYKELTKKRNKGKEFVQAFIKTSGLLGGAVSAYGVYKKNISLIVGGIISQVPDAIDAAQWISDGKKFGGWDA